MAASLLAYLQGWLLNGIVQRTIATLRRDVEDKLHRLPLGYVDPRARGELLSRVTNDIDNVSQSLQQTMSQLLTSLLTVVGVLVMMVVISPLLAVIALLTVPLSTWMTRAIARRSQGEFVAQWRYTGELNGQIEEAFTGHELVTVFGRRGEVEETFAAKNAQLRDASYRAQFVSGIIMPSMMFLGNLNYVAVAVIGALRVATGAMTLGEVQAFIQYSRQFTQPLTQVASMANLLQSGVASAERVFELLDAARAGAGAGACPRSVRSDAAGWPSSTCRSGTDPDVPLIDDLSLVAEPGQTVAIVGPDRRGQDHAGEPRDALLRAGRGPDHAGRRGHRDDGARGPALRDRDGAAGHLAVRRNDPGEHRLRQPGGDRGATARRGAGRPTSTGSSAACRTATTPASTPTAARSAPGRSS